MDSRRRVRYNVNKLLVFFCCFSNRLNIKWKFEILKLLNRISIIPPTKSGNTKNAAKPYFPFSRYPDKEEGDKTFNDMPANCKDLQLIGYKFSGIYLVMKLENGNKSTKIEAIFCSFDQSDSEKNTGKYS